MKKTVQLSAVVIAAVMLMAGTVAAAPINNNVNVTINNGMPPIEETGQSARVAWDQGIIEAVGIGIPPANTVSVGQSRALAKRAAIVDAYRNLAESIQGVQVDAETTMSNLAISSDVVKTKVSGLIKGARVIREQALPDGSYQVVMNIKLYGNDGLAGVALNAIKPEQTQEFPAPIPTTNINVNVPVKNIPTNKLPALTSQYTGVIIDGRGLGLQSTFSPRVYDETNRIVYGNMYIDTDFAISEGMVEYTITPEMAQGAESGQSRAGANPLIIKALRVVDANSCNVVISNADASAMLSYNQSAGFLRRCAVVFER